MTITFPVIKGKLAAFLYLATLFLMAALAWAQIDQALTARDDYELHKHQLCSGTAYGSEDYTSAERDAYEAMCGHPPRSDED